MPCYKIFILFTGWCIYFTTYKQQLVPVFPVTPDLVWSAIQDLLSFSKNCCWRSIMSEGSERIDGHSSPTKSTKYDHLFISIIGNNLWFWWSTISLISNKWTITSKQWWSTIPLISNKWTITSKHNLPYRVVGPCRLSISVNVSISQDSCKILIYSRFCF